MDILQLLNSLSAKELHANGDTWIIACLGNIGEQYEGTRHNVGFTVADALIKEYSATGGKITRKSQEYETRIGGRRTIIIKPQTFMNSSGEAVGAEAQFYKADSRHIIVIYDDINLAPGVLRIRENGSAGGHNGMKSIIAHLGTEDFPRIRIGVGAKPHPDADLAGHVLSKPSKEEAEQIRATTERACKAVPMIMDGKASDAQSMYAHQK